MRSMMAPPMKLDHGLCLLQEASIAISASLPFTTSPNSSSLQSNRQQIDQPPHLATSPPRSRPSCTSVSALLNPAPPDIAAALPPGFTLGEDGKVRKKRGRKPTPGLTDEDRRQARLLKNRRTAETSRRRKLALMKTLTSERDQAVQIADKLKKHNAYLLDRLAKALGTSVSELVDEHPDVLSRDIEDCAQSDVSTQTNTASSVSDASVKKQ